MNKDQREMPRAGGGRAPGGKESAGSSRSLGSAKTIGVAVVWAVAVSAAFSRDAEHGAWLAVATFALTPVGLCLLTRRRGEAIRAVDAEAKAWDDPGGGGHWSFRIGLTRPTPFGRRAPQPHPVAVTRSQSLAR